jgi:hypothetical protein
MKKDAIGQQGKSIIYLDPYLQFCDGRVVSAATACKKITDFATVEISEKSNCNYAINVTPNCLFITR